MANSEYATRSVGFLSWLDTFERADNLILEIRHVQETIASQLHIPDFSPHIPNFSQNGPSSCATILYEPLRYEDHYLWGRYTASIADEKAVPKDWSTILDPLHKKLRQPISQSSSTLAALWCPEFPSASGGALFYEKIPDDDKNAELFDKGTHDVQVTNLKLVRALIGTENRFSANDDRLYNALRHLQLIKRDMLRDKLVLAYRALEAFSKDFYADPPLARFLVVRRAALHSLHLRLEAFRDILSTVEETLNLSMERDPPPTVRRRRDQGIYTTDLADNCDFIARDICDFFATSIGADRIPDGTTVLDNELEFIVHTYARQHTSTYRYDHIWNESPQTKPERALAAGFVQSSFWMPERPDLQPIIVHEVAHLLIQHHYKSFEPFALDRMDDPFGRLLRQMSYVFEAYAPRFTFFDFSPRVREQLLREISCDLIGVAVHRTSYVFAQFLEMICSGAEWLFKPFPNGDIAQSIERLGEEFITYIRALRPEWLTRLSIPLAFSRALLAYDDNRAEYLEGVLHDGIEGALDAVRREYSHWMDGDQKEDWDTWFEMTCVLRDVVGKAALVDATSKWLRSRHQQARSDAPRNRHVPPIPKEIVDICLAAWLDRLVEPPRMLGTYLDATHHKPKKIQYEDVIAGFRALYLNGASRGFLSASGEESRLFNHLVDIPWQTALLTAHDFFGDPESCRYGVERADWISGMHEFNWLGRDLYHSALEYVVWFERPAIGRLKAMNRWLISVEKAIDAVSEETRGHPSLGAAVERLRPFAELVSSILGTDIDGPNLKSDPTLKKQLDEALERKLKALHKQADQARVGWGHGFPWSPESRAIDGNWQLGSRLICRFDPDRSRAVTIDPSIRRRDWRYFFDRMATAHMDYAGEEIAAALSKFLEAEDNSELIGKLARALNRPISEDPSATSEPRAAPESAQAAMPMQGTASAAGVPAPDEEAYSLEEAVYTQYGRIILELISVTHYLDIRPDRVPGRGRATAHHAHSGFESWNSVFSQYLDVPIYARKHEGDEKSKFIRNLVPTRSVRVDRFSHPYEPRAPANNDPGHLPSDNIRNGPMLFWRSWVNGIRPTLGESQEKPLRFRRTRLRTPLLGRFDHLTLDVARHTARSGQYSSWPGVPFFRRQQIGVPFAAHVDTNRGEVSRAESHEVLELALQTCKCDDPPRDNILLPQNIPIPLATISILLVQRSARLTFVERLLAEDLVARSFSNKRLSSPYRHFKPELDIGLLTDGWGDVFLVLFAKPRTVPDNFVDYVERCNEVRPRFDQVITLRKSIFEDTLVVRSETSYTPLAVDTALLRPDLYRTTLSMRFRTTRDGMSLADEFERHLHQLFKVDSYQAIGREGVSLSDVLTYSRIAGRTDYQISSKQLPAEKGPLVQAVYRSLCESNTTYARYGLSPCTPESYRKYGIIFERLRKLVFKEGLIEKHVDTTATSIAELRFPKH